MSNDKLFAIDTDTEEIIVSMSPKDSKKIDLIERIARQDNDILFNAVITLTSITKSPDFDITLFKAMDRVCQMIYDKQNEASK